MHPLFLILSFVNTDWKILLLCRMYAFAFGQLFPEVETMSNWVFARFDFYTSFYTCNLITLQICLETCGLLKWCYRFFNGMSIKTDVYWGVVVLKSVCTQSAIGCWTHLGVFVSLYALIYPNHSRKHILEKLSVCFTTMSVLLWFCSRTRGNLRFVIHSKPKISVKK